VRFPDGDAEDEGAAEADGEAEAADWDGASAAGTVEAELDEGTAAGRLAAAAELAGDGDGLAEPGAEVGLASGALGAAARPQPLNSSAEMKARMKRLDMFGTPRMSVAGHGHCAASSAMLPALATIGGMPAESYVRLDKADFQFCAAHFCVFPGEREPLHGHNYRVYVELRGGVDELGYVAEFGWLKKIVRDLVAGLDHRVILAERCPGLSVQRRQGQLEVRWQDDCWAFPEGDAICLPIANTTAELLAGYLWDKVRQHLSAPTAWGTLTVEVEETPGQRAGISRGIDGHG